MDEKEEKAAKNIGKTLGAKAEKEFREMISEADSKCAEIENWDKRLEESIRKTRGEKAAKDFRLLHDAIQKQDRLFPSGISEFAEIRNEIRELSRLICKSTIELSLRHEIAPADAQEELFAEVGEEMFRQVKQKKVKDLLEKLAARAREVKRVDPMAPNVKIDFKRGGINFLSKIK